LEKPAQYRFVAGKSVRMSVLRFAILGAARIAKGALIDPALGNDKVEIVAIGAFRLERAREFAVLHGIPHAGSYEDVIARDDVDVVYIALPPTAHTQWTLKALAAGKHVFLEKPATTSLEEAQEIVAAAQKAGKRLIEGFHYRWHPMFNRAVEIVRTGVIGDLVSATAEFSAPIPRNEIEFRWRADLGGGALADLGCYPVHWLRHLAGQEPVVTSANQILEPDGIDRRSEAHFSFPRGLEADLITDMDPPHGERRAFVKVVGTKGTLTLINPIAPQYGHELKLVIDGVESSESFTKRATFAFQLDGIVEAILNDTPVLTEGTDIIGNAAVMAAIRQLA
jgi:predicted dehydrogenase